MLYVVAWFGALKLQKGYSKNSNGPSKLFVYTYFSLSITTLILYNLDVYKYMWTEQITLFPLFYLFIMLMISGLPILNYDRAHISAIQKPSSSLINAFVWIYILSILLDLPNAILKVQDGFSVLLTSAGGGEELYSSMEERFMEKSSGSSSLLVSLLSVFHNAFSEIGIMVFYFYLSLKEKQKWIVVLLSINILLSVLLPLAGGGRTNCTMVILNVVLGFFIFRDFWEVKLQSVFRKTFLVLMILVSIPFVALTISRWANRIGGVTAIDGIFFYIGEAPLFFDMYALDAGGIRNGDRTCNLPKKWLGYDVPENFREARYLYNNMKLDDMYYSTFIGDFVLDFGPFLATIMVISFSLICIQLTKPRVKIMPFHRRILLYYITCVCIQGSFYLFFYSYHLGWKIVGFVLSYLVFYFDYMNNQKRISFISKKR